MSMYGKLSMPSSKTPTVIQLQLLHAPSVSTNLASLEYFTEDTETDYGILYTHMATTGLNASHLLKKFAITI